MCLDCTEGEHREHVTVPLRDVLEQHKAALKNQLDAIHNRYMSYILNSQMSYTVHPFINNTYINTNTLHAYIILYVYIL